MVHMQMRTLVLARGVNVSHCVVCLSHLSRLSMDTTTQRNMTGARHRSTTLIPYKPAEWVCRLTYIPKYRVQLAHPNTPIHKWNLPQVPEGFSIHVKRDDLTGSTLSGNKVRKLEFLLADAIDKGCGHVITLGGIQSNHCRAVAVAACQLGLTPHLLLRTDIQDPDSVDCSGNVLIDRMCGAHLYLVPKFSTYLADLKPRQEKLAQILQQETGKDSYLIPVGGSNKVGLFGYISVFEELISQGILEDFDDIVFTCGSGGTASGLSIGNYLTGSKLKCHGIIVCDTEEYFYDHVQETLDEVGLAEVKSRDIVDIIGGYKGKGYGISTDEELDFITQVSMKSGLLLDPTYTGKAVRGLVKELTSNPGRFKGQRILFIHSGGIFGLFDGRFDRILKTNSNTNKVKVWQDKDNDPS